MTSSHKPIPLWMQERRNETLDRIERALTNLQLLSIINFMALLWILYLVGGKG